MRNMPWIKASGEAAPGQAASLIDGFLADSADVRYIAFHSDRFSAGYAATVSQELTETLLELRAFSADAELRLVRTSLAENFQYRIADDRTLKANAEALDTADPFLKDPGHYVSVGCQVLDINEKYPPYLRKEKNEKGCLLLCTTGGGRYALPIAPDDDVALVKNYLAYDAKTGVAGVADTRLASFEKWKEAKRT